jgi:hypothetical protein
MSKSTYTDQQLKEAVEKSKSYRQASLALGLCGRGGGAYGILKRRIKDLCLDVSHFSGQGWLKGITPEWSVKKIDYYLKLNGPMVANQNLKKRLISTGLKKDECEVCGQGPVWNNKPLVLQLDHKNGNYRDNRLENLRIICPHCHTQTPTFAGRRFKKPTLAEIDPKWRHRSKPNIRKVVRPSKKDLESMISYMSWVDIGRKYKVSDNAIRKWATTYGIQIEIKKHRKTSGDVMKLADNRSSKGLAQE